MSKLSRFLIGIIITGLAFIASVHLYRAYEKYAAAQQEQLPAAQTFHNVPVWHTPIEPEIPVYKKYDEDQVKEIYLEDQPLAPEMTAEQARQTVKSILSDYEQEPAVKQFYEEVRQATDGKEIKLEDLSGENLPALLKENPQLLQVISQHTKDPAFAKTLQEIFANPQFAQSVAVLQSEQQQGRK